MFFEPPPSQEFIEPPTPPPMPPWQSPPAEESGVIVPLQLTIARSDHVAVVLTSARSYSTGCLFLVEVISRRHTMPFDKWWELRGSGHSAMLPGATPDGLPDRMLRFGVRYSDGTKATTVGGPFHGRSKDEPSADVMLTWTPFGGGGRSGGGQDYGHSTHGLWLWPLPPAEPIEFAVEWPLGGIDLTIVELDGAQLAGAAEHSHPYWP